MDKIFALGPIINSFVYRVSCITTHIVSMALIARLLVYDTILDYNTSTYLCFEEVAWWNCHQRILLLFMESDGRVFSFVRTLVCLDSPFKHEYAFVWSSSHTRSFTPSWLPYLWCNFWASWAQTWRSRIALSQPLTGIFYTRELTFDPSNIVVKHIVLELASCAMKKNRSK